MADVVEMERLRAESLSMVSHELRDPLTSCKGSAVNLRESLNSLAGGGCSVVRIIESSRPYAGPQAAELLTWPHQDRHFRSSRAGRGHRLVATAEHPSRAAGERHLFLTWNLTCPG